jgi:cell filamentation protein
MAKYSVQGTEGSYQAGSNGLVLANKLAITLPEEMNEAETHLLSLLYSEVLSSGAKDLANLSVSELQYWHYAWLGEVYDWAGQFRTVNMSKDDFAFCGAKFIEPHLVLFEDKYLKQLPYLSALSTEKLVAFLAESHVEFILIHPFREGNGRIARLLLDVMACTAGYAPLDYSLWLQNKEYYFKSIQAGAGGSYEYMEKLVKDVLLSEL